MSNAMLYQSMLKCDGTQKNCQGCAFKGIPDCRNAMAHHAGALIQLQEVVIDNAGQQSAAQMNTIRKLEAEKKQVVEAWGELNGAMVNLLEGLKEERHCASCKNRTDENHKEICKQCREAASMYTLDLDYGKKPDPCEECLADSDECEGCAHNPENE